MYTVKERIEETGGKDYSIFDVVSPDGVTVASYSALDYGGGAAGVENAEYDALEKRIELNTELRSKQVQNAFVSEVVANINLEQETEALRQRIAELENACEKALDALENFEEFDTVLAKAYLREVIEPNNHVTLSEEQIQAFATTPSLIENNLYFKREFATEANLKAISDRRRLLGLD